MNNEAWFRLIKQWKDSGRGHYGLTFPFLVGALAKLKAQEPTREFVGSLFLSIMENPIPGYYGEVRWCGDINEPVLSVNPIDRLDSVSIKDDFKVCKITSLAFTTDLMSMFHLNCENAEECLEKLIERTHEITKDALFSKNNGAFTGFTEDDLHFIAEVLNVKVK